MLGFLEVNDDTFLLKNHIPAAVPDMPSVIPEQVIHHDPEQAIHQDPAQVVHQHQGEQNAGVMEEEKELGIINGASPDLLLIASPETIDDILNRPEEDHDGSGHEDQEENGQVPENELSSPKSSKK